MASKNINIRKDARGDAHYRYKMPQLETKVEGKGNGVKTVLPNIADVARALSRPPEYPTKFFGCELGAQTMFDNKADRYIVNGIHDAPRLRELLDNFIDKFVLCGSCKNPETDLIITKDEMILRDCKACGERKAVDMRHKLVTYILKNPPKKPSKKKDTGSPNGNDAEAAEEGSDDDFMSKKIKAGADQMSRVAVVDADEVDWSADTSKAAQAARMEALNGGVSNIAIQGEDDDEEAGGPYDVFKKWVQENKDEQTDAQIYARAEEMGLAKKHKTVQALVEGLFDASTLVNGKEVEKHAPLFGKLFSQIDNEEKSQKSLLGGIERSIGLTYPELISPEKVSIVLMNFYQASILDEEAATNWGKHVSKKYVPKEVSKQVRLAARGFIKWLEEAESSEEAEE